MSARAGKTLRDRPAPQGDARGGSLATLALACASLLPALLAAADDPASTGAGPDLRVAKIKDVATWVSVPVTQDKSFVMGLPERFWIQCPRHSSVPTSLEGDGLVLQFMNPRGGTHSLLYVGAVALPEPMQPEKIEVRVEKAAKDFAADLKAKYARVDFALKDAQVTVDRATVLIGGKKQPAWRTSHYVTLPAVAVSGPNPTFAGECLFFLAEGTESMVYVALNSKSGGTSLDRVLGDFSVKPTADVARTARVVQLNDIFNAKDGRFPVRLVSYESPPGFAPTYDVVRIKTELVYAEDRLDDKRVVTGSIRFDQRDADANPSLARIAEEERQAVVWGKPTAAVAVPLATEGARALVYRYSGTVAERSYTAHAAILLLDDKVLKITWSTFGDAATADADAAALDRMLRSMQVAIRSSRS